MQNTRGYGIKERERETEIETEIIHILQIKNLKKNIIMMHRKWFIKTTYN